MKHTMPSSWLWDTPCHHLDKRTPWDTPCHHLDNRAPWDTPCHQLDKRIPWDSRWSSGLWDTPCRHLDQRTPWVTPCHHLDKRAPWDTPCHQLDKRIPWDTRWSPAGQEDPMRHAMVTSWTRGPYETRDGHHLDKREDPPWDKQCHERNLTGLPTVLVPGAGSPLSELSGLKDPIDAPTHAACSCTGKCK